MTKHTILDRSGKKLELSLNVHKQLFITMEKRNTIGHQAAITLDKGEVQEVIGMLNEIVNRI